MKNMKLVLVMLVVTMVGFAVNGLADETDLNPIQQKQNMAQTTCPVMKGGKINKKLYVDHNGKRIYVCCKVCINKVKADPE